MEAYKTQPLQHNFNTLIRSTHTTDHKTTHTPYYKLQTGTAAACIDTRPTSTTYLKNSISSCWANTICAMLHCQADACCCSKTQMYAAHLLQCWLSGVHNKQPCQHIADVSIIVAYMLQLSQARNGSASMPSQASITLYYTPLAGCIMSVADKAMALQHVHMTCSHMPKTLA